MTWQGQQGGRKREGAGMVKLWHAEGDVRSRGKQVQHSQRPWCHWLAWHLHHYCPRLAAASAPTFQGFHPSQLTISSMWSMYSCGTGRYRQYNCGSTKQCVIQSSTCLRVDAEYGSQPAAQPATQPASFTVSCASHQPAAPPPAVQPTCFSASGLVSSNRR